VIPPRIIGRKQDQPQAAPAEQPPAQATLAAQVPAPVTAASRRAKRDWTFLLSWIVTGSMVFVMLILVYQRVPAMIEETLQPVQQEEETQEPDDSAYGENTGEASLPQLNMSLATDAIVRHTNTHTILLNKTRDEAVEYTVEKGDAIFGIANKYKLKPETILWANYAILNDNPHEISIGQVLTIPPTDGIYYKWEEGDTVASVAKKYGVKPEDILNYPGNKLDLADPDPMIEKGTYIMVPGGYREFKQWLVPTIWKSGAGANKSIAGPGGCAVGDGGAVGTGSFVWPSGNNFLSGNDYWSGHLGIDIAATFAPVYAADSGVAVYAGAIGGGYGNMIMIDHGNGYHTLYAHLDAVYVSCGASVTKGQMIALSGNSGNSTGPHLHFEVRYQGGFINPWYVLP